ncbi:probable RNA-binding protein CG14230 [Macrosteles quadrilineatus]|uniref:probable RNA-binding protein CG14230 n=1 Tax=Macrosteles quadrilineatus TaxID=74068 RepID=UPI0023E22786|nr:probable RNA-binding protein CG14230 [Macrosteles quadrilineatus]XP_054290652.1 probable RNA-binding protein CG14230 [Macrosteles quadrilineatus]
MTLQSKKHYKDKSIVQNINGFPMKPFKGTKFHLGDGQNTDLPTLKKRPKAGIDPSTESQMKKAKIDDPLNVMTKLEEFSDVWNDCPDVENPKSDFEIVPSGKNVDKNLNRENKYEKKMKNFEGFKTSKWSDRSEAKQNAHMRDEDGHNNFHNLKNKVETNKIAAKEEVAVVENHTKSEKYDSKIAEMKRKKAVQEQSQLHADQKNIIKKALSTLGKEQVNKKIVFSDAEESEPKVSLEGKTNKLFEDDDSASEQEVDFKLKVNTQFEGKKGHKLMELQSKFASDSRFNLDSRFHESESENELDEAHTESVDIETEKKRQLEILESIVKQPIRPFSEARKITDAKSDGSLMVRFDPTREDHQKYLLKPQKPSEDKEPQDKTKKSKKERNTLLNEESRPQVSKEKVYDVKEDLKEVLKQGNKSDFSLLKLFGSKDEDTNTQQQSGSESVKKLKYATKNPFKYDSSESDSEEEEEKVKSLKTKPTIPSWKTTFFFTENDSRLKEAEEFLKLPEEHEGDQEFAEKRKMLKDFIRHKVKNSNRKKDPFKKKLGGGSKKSFHKKKGK